VVQPPASSASPDATARQLSCEIFVLGFPLVLMDTIRRAHPLAVSGFRLFPPASQDLVPGLFHDDPDCLHTCAIVDLATGPSVLHLPNTHGRYISVTLIDAAGEPFAGLGSRTGDHLAGDIVLAGPNWRGEVREGVRALRTPCDSVWAVTRIIGRSVADRPTVESFAARQSFSFGQAADAAPPGGTTHKFGMDVLDLGALRQIAAVEPPALFHRLLQLVDRAPRPVQERLGVAVRGRLSLLDRSRAETEGRTGEAMMRGFADGWNAIAAARRVMVAEPSSQWTSATQDVAATAGPAVRAAAVLSALGAPLRDDILTLSCNADESGRPLTGEEQYRIVLSAARLPPALSAWRLTAPGRDTRTPGDVIGDHSPLILGPNGSLELFIQKDPPRRRQQVNWLRAPAGPFELKLRLYAPTLDALDGTWRMVAVERLGSRADGRLDGSARRASPTPSRRLRDLAPAQQFSPAQQWSISA
jgi:hypothetical protein